MHLQNFLPPRRRPAGMTLLEVLVAICLFVVAGLAVVQCQMMFNRIAARNRCDAAAQAILRAKIAKVLADPWDVAVPKGCVVTSGAVDDVADPADPYDVGPTVTLLAGSGSSTQGIVTGTLKRQTTRIEAFPAPNSVAIDYTLTYVFLGKTYTVTASTVRAMDRYVAGS